MKAIVSDARRRPARLIPSGTTLSHSVAVT
jgi:hypothetical protein